MGKLEELSLMSSLEDEGLRCIHQLTQSHISEFLRYHPNQRAKYWLAKNQELPRERLTYEVDVFAWKPGHWASLAIEEKSQMQTVKTLAFENQHISMYNKHAEFQRNAQNLFMQCCGAGYLGRAYSSAMGIPQDVLPVGVVDYDIELYGTKSNWTYYNGVMFVNKKYFQSFLKEFLSPNQWMREMVLQQRLN